MMKRRIGRMTLLVLVLTLIAGGLQTAHAVVLGRWDNSLIYIEKEQGYLVFDPVEWIGLDVDYVIQRLEEIGYNDGSKTIMNTKRVFSTKLEPNLVSVSFDTASKRINHVSCEYSASKDNYERVCTTLEQAFGKPSYSEAYTEEKGNYTITYSDRLIWEHCGCICVVNGEGDAENNSIADLKLGKSPFIVNVFIKAAEGTAYSAEIQKETGKMLPIATPTTKATAKPTVKPTAKPKPTARVSSEISIYSVSIKQDSIGTPQIFVRLRNNSKNSVDRIDFSVKCYDAYGALVKGYGVYSQSACFYDASTIKSGGITPSDYRWTFYGYDGVKSIEIAITKYHFTNGKTVEIPEEQYVWIKYK